MTNEAIDEAEGLAARGRLTEAGGVLDSWLAQVHGAEDDADLARAMVARAKVHGALGDAEEEAELDDEVREQFGESTDSVLMALTATAMVDRADALVALGHHDEALSQLDDVVDWLAGEPAAALVDAWGRAMVAKGALLVHAGRLADADAVFTTAAERTSGTTDPGRLGVHLSAVAGAARVAIECGRFDEGVAQLDDAASMGRAASDAAPRARAAAAMREAADALVAARRIDEALRRYDDDEAAFADDDGVVGTEVAAAMVHRARALHDFDRLDDAAAACETVIARFEDAQRADVLVFVARAMMLEARILGEQREWGGSIILYEEVRSRFGDLETPAMQTVVRAAREHEANLPRR